MAPKKAALATAEAEFQELMVGPHAHTCLRAQEIPRDSRLLPYSSCTPHPSPSQVGLNAKKAELAAVEQRLAELNAKLQEMQVRRLASDIAAMDAP